MIFGPVNFVLFKRLIEGQPIRGCIKNPVNRPLNHIFLMLKRCTAAKTARTPEHLLSILTNCFRLLRCFVSFPESLFYMFTAAQVIFDVNSQVLYCICICQIFNHISKFRFFPRNVILAHLSSASSILFDLTHVAMLSRSSRNVQ